MRVRYTECPRSHIPVARRVTAFSRKIIAWQRRHGRHDLPWQGTRDPYVIWVSEIMLQQTQVTTVIPYFLRFIRRFPDVMALAAATDDEVMKHWSGLGYYSRARNLRKAAMAVMDSHAGRFPGAYAELVELPGIGPSTAGAISAFSTGERRAILDGNVKRVLARCRAIGGYPGNTDTARRLWAAAESLLPDADIESYTQGMMDLGAQVCLRRKPLCGACPVADECVAYTERRVADFPGAKPRKTVPRRVTTMLILRRDDKVYLERRPPVGIWGGLLSLPETDGTADLSALLRDRFGVQLQNMVQLAAVEHQFTHFHLTITPLLCEVSDIPESVHSDTGSWALLREAAASGVPAPVKRILDTLVEEAAHAGRLF
jgi:A/G-specific adenine glycosylase